VAGASIISIVFADNFYILFGVGVPGGEPEAPQVQGRNTAFGAKPGSIQNEDAD
jgi:hypothetical protein